MIRKAIVVVHIVAAVSMGALWLWVAPAPDGFLSSKVATPQFRLTHSKGELLLSHGVFLENKPPGVIDGYVREWRSPGFLYTRYWTVPTNLQYINGRSLSVRYWFLVLLLNVFPAIAFIRGPFHRWHRARRGHCGTCGYDLTGNASGTCPECGEKIARHVPEGRRPPQKTISCKVQ